jgi:hypothetical protein
MFDRAWVDRYIATDYHNNININSFRNKFGFIKDLLISNTCDMLTIAKTKLDESFNGAQFQIENFHLWRADRTANGL